jgi:Suppressor of fused protein (SUFU)
MEKRTKKGSWSVIERGTAFSEAEPCSFTTIPSTAIHNSRYAASMDSPDQTWQEWFESAWALREEKVFPALFGTVGPGIYPLDYELFANQFGQTSVDPRWLNHGVFESPPNSARKTWLYVSSGLSNAWEAELPSPNGVSGLGCEFILECPSQSQWALLLVRRMVAFQILLGAGRFTGKTPLKVWERIPLRAPIDGLSSALNWVLLAPPPQFAETQQIPSGRFDLIQFVGITEEEAAYARANGSDKLFQLLQQSGAAPATDPNRVTIPLETAD